MAWHAKIASKKSLALNKHLLSFIMLLSSYTMIIPGTVVVLGASRGVKKGRVVISKCVEIDLSNS